MGKRPAEDELFVGNMGSIQREVRTSMQREDKPTMETGLERIAAKARSEPKLRFTSLAHHITRERVWTNLCQIPKRSAPGVDGQTVTEYGSILDLQKPKNAGQLVEVVFTPTSVATNATIIYFGGHRVWGDLSNLQQVQ